MKDLRHGANPRHTKRKVHKHSLGPTLLRDGGPFQRLKKRSSMQGQEQEDDALTNKALASITKLIQAARYLIASFEITTVPERYTRDIHSSCCC
jgi:hypothetical protein